MKRISGNSIILVLLGSIILAACGLAGTPAPSSPAPKAALPAPAEPTWKQDWEKTLAAARKENKVHVINRLPPGVRDTLNAAFREKFGIEIEYIVGSALEHWPKIEAERRSGMYLRDVVMDGYSALTTTAVAAGVAEPMEPAFILPEVKDGTAWRDKRLPFYDKEGKIFMYVSRVAPTIVINKDLVKPEDLKSWRNLLDPRWKGKMVMYDPSIPGPGAGLLTTLVDILGTDYLRELARQDPVMNRDMRMQVEWVARGKYPMGLGFEFTLFEEMRGAGAPIANVVPAEGTYFGSGFGAMTMFERAAHPDATRVFINWFLSKEGQTLFARTAKEQSRRTDVPSELAPDRLFQEGIKYVDSDTEEVLKKRLEMQQRLSKEIFAAQYK